MEIHFIASKIWCLREQENRKKKFLFKILKKENSKEEISVGRERKQGNRKIKFLFKIPKKEDTKEEISGRGEKTEENLGKIKVWRYKMMRDFYKIADELKERQSQMEEAVVFNNKCSGLFINITASWCPHCSSSSSVLLTFDLRTC